MFFDPLYVVLGLLVGIIVGLTGVGGGSLMTPLLIFVFHVKPALAVGTDLLFAAITKATGMVKHQRHGNIDWRITGLLGLGSIPASLLTLWWLHVSQIDSARVNVYMMKALGFMLFLTAIAIFLTQVLRTRYVKPDPNAEMQQHHSRPRTMATVIIGAALGFLVTFSSVGAGAVGMVALYALYNRSPAVRLVGSDIAHAVPLTLIAGLGHAGLGSVNFQLLGVLLIGSLPGIWIGSHLSNKAPERVLKLLLAIILTISGYKLIA